ncbi:hypothetical protein Lser_V15G43346 [Lactuca serriola]
MNMYFCHRLSTIRASVTVAIVRVVTLHKPQEKNSQLRIKEALSASIHSEIGTVSFKLPMIG